jgi:hypothetical protein
VESPDMVVITTAQEIDAILLSLNGDFSHIVNYPQTLFSYQADLRVAILFSKCIGDLSRAGVRVQRPVNRNLGSREYRLTFKDDPLPCGCG